MIGIYKITNINNESYIGQSIDIERRIRQHKRCKKDNSKLYMSLKTFGVENHAFKIINGTRQTTTRRKINYITSLRKIKVY